MVCPLLSLSASCVSAIALSPGLWGFELFFLFLPLTRLFKASRSRRPHYVKEVRPQAVPFSSAQFGPAPATPSELHANTLPDPTALEPQDLQSFSAGRHCPPGSDFASNHILDLRNIPLLFLTSVSFTVCAVP
ncbi:uncharacterized protein K452DRAFT_340796 [Aplosporella prunicola CBS 121167]|uniref:Uncharacterized protein n=1 Tax=Aplosporella prunicola CBS 121167 TaxID=1176127 RepID=A0A6A6BSC9_9PEZI|nr:uncharacterized protein K452DRAFT_340796 [Aplosporella prunicola CBS 121167]KAF2146185.1 hypothetical protein K452DRAFT_340796 [Aplosporella prunicola CBS 121167]